MDNRTKSAGLVVHPESSHTNEAIRSRKFPVVGVHFFLFSLFLLLLNWSNYLFSSPSSTLSSSCEWMNEQHTTHTHTQRTGHGTRWQSNCRNETASKQEACVVHIFLFPRYIHLKQVAPKKEPEDC